MNYPSYLSPTMLLPLHYYFTLNTFFGLLLLNFASGEHVDLDEMLISENECKETGFNPIQLKCSACRLLPQFNLEEIMTGTSI